MEEDGGDDFVNSGSEAVSVVSFVNDLGRHVACQSFVSNQGHVYDADGGQLSFFLNVVCTRQSITFQY